MFEALQAAVTLAKTEQIRTVKALRGRLEAMGFPIKDIDEAITTWADYTKDTMAHQRP